MDVNGVAAAALRAGEQPTLTLTFMVLWFFLVFFRNCLRLPDDMYSVMNMTWGKGGLGEEAGQVSAVRHAVRQSDRRRVWKKKRKKYPHPCLGLLHVQPVFVELDNVGMLDLHQVLKHLLDLLLEHNAD